MLITAETIEKCHEVRKKICTCGKVFSFYGFHNSTCPFYVTGEQILNGTEKEGPNEARSNHATV